MITSPRNSTACRNAAPIWALVLIPRNISLFVAHHYVRNFILETYNTQNGSIFLDSLQPQHHRRCNQRIAEHSRTTAEQFLFSMSAELRKPGRVRCPHSGTLCGWENIRNDSRLEHSHEQTRSRSKRKYLYLHWYLNVTEHSGTFHTGLPFVDIMIVLVLNRIYISISHTL